MMRAVEALRLRVADPTVQWVDGLATSEPAADVLGMWPGLDPGSKSFYAGTKSIAQLRLRHTPVLIGSNVTMSHLSQLTVAGCRPSR